MGILTSFTVHMNMRRLIGLMAIEIEAVETKTQRRRHLANLITPSLIGPTTELDCRPGPCHHTGKTLLPAAPYRIVRHAPPVFRAQQQRPWRRRQSSGPCAPAMTARNAAR